ncbi:NADH-quinone oxidoreductase subunit NuoK [Anaplasma capra]|uniref:NADH-quinone oxidoreductase subunit NuoK n=1 Tax=Anaplasma capra TaxID=1562740 RepID=UPI0021D57CD6|nr:NADH-quinone oxidoreductase subunit NuoK [Anaplasma capra]MCU7611587.1 NADH-quinone oxidoreductase subunit NuoK [Anaplasma capra]MCU7611974.1 NADH-quinone oxidoreductase subunit NuoK [Anaplasma capra]
MEFLINAGVSLNHFLVLSAILFVIGGCGIVVGRKSAINALLSLELMLLAVNMNFVAFSAYKGDIHGQIFAIFVLVVAAAESAVGLAVMLAHFRNVGNIDLSEASSLKM